MSVYLLIGATGTVGSNVAQAVLGQGHKLKIFTSEPNTSTEAGQKKKLAIDNLVSNGAEIAYGSVSNVSDIEKALHNVDFVISTFSGDFTLQKPIVDAIANHNHKGGNVKRFLPSEFGVNVRIPPAGFCAMFDQKRTVQDYIKERNVPYTFVYVGAFADWWAKPDTVYGDGSVKVIYTALKDIAALAVKVAADPRTLNREVQTVGDVATTRHIQSVFKELHPAKASIVDNATHVSIQDLHDQRNSQDLITKIYGQVKYAIFIDGVAGFVPENVLDTRTLYPEYTTSKVRDFVA